jgi:Icc-related predicted phosphoesterase
MNIIKNKYSELRGIKTIAILADPGCRPGWKKNFTRLLERVWRAHHPDLFLVAGDLVLNGSPAEYEETISVIQRYPAVWAAVPGDHDPPLKNFVRYFGSTRKVIDVGKWRFIGVNTANRMFLKSESDFIKKHLRPNSIILSHVPPEAEGWTFHSLWPRSSDRFLSIIDRHRGKIRAAFFGHIHGYSVRKRSGVPLIATGAVAESFAVRDNRYAGPGFFEMMIFNTTTGAITLCAMKSSA